MIPRYSRKEMESIWSPQNRFQKWLDIEILACEALAQKGDIPRKALRTIKEKARFDVDRIDEIERTVKHDVIAFLTSVAEFVGPDSRFIHMGLTSSDILDTSLGRAFERGRGHPPGRHRRPDDDPEKKGLPVQKDPHDRADPRDPCRTGHLRPQDGPVASGNGKKPRAAHPGKGFDRLREDLGGRGNLCLHRPLRGGIRLQKTGPQAGTGGHADRPARPPRRVFLGSGHSSPLPWKNLPPRSATFSAPRCARPRNISRRGRKAPRRCPTSATPSCPKISRGSRG